MNRGVLYIVWGSKALYEATESIKSLWKVEADMPVQIVGDSQIGSIGSIGRPGQVSFKVLDVDPFLAQSFMAGRVKPCLYAESRFTETLYVDADTRFRKSPRLGFDLLKKWDAVVSDVGYDRSIGQELGSHLPEARATDEMFGILDMAYHNSGMLFWQRNKRVKRLFELWSEEWMRFQRWDEQVPLLRALARSDVIYLAVPHTWNTNHAYEAFLLLHDFGKRLAWKFKRSRGVSMTAAEMRQLAGEMRARATPLVRVGVMTGADRRQSMRVKQEEATKEAIRVRQLRKPRQAPRNKALPAPPRNMTAEEMADVHA